MSLFLLLVACDGGGTSADPVSVTLPFAATVGGAPFACGTPYDGVGTTGVTAEALDFRLYVYDVTLVDAEGVSAPVALEQDGVWQYEQVALLDFEDGTGGCETGSPSTRTEIVGTVPEGDYVGLSFVVGVPPELNHLDAATAPAPLNDPGLWWTWTSGYRFARIDVATEQNPGFVFHLGATDCGVSDTGEYTCVLDNNAPIALDFDPDADRVVLDLLRLYEDNDLDAAPDYVTDFTSGCMSLDGDPECEPLMGKFGLPFGDVTTPPAQRLFAVEAR